MSFYFYNNNNNIDSLNHHPSLNDKTNNTIIGFQLVKAYEYPIKVIKINGYSSKINKIIIHPIESKFGIELKEKNKLIDIIKDEELISARIINEEKKRLFGSKNDLVVELKWQRNDHLKQKELSGIFNVEDKYAKEIISNIKNCSKVPDGYWEKKPIETKDSSGQRTSIDLFWRTPFLASGEEIVLYNIGTEGIINKSIKWLEVITNYRILEYVFNDHTSNVIVMEGIDDVVVMNRHTSSQTYSIGNYYSGRHSIMGFSNRNSTSRTIGDVVIMNQGKPFITLNQVSDPQGVKNLIKSMKKQRLGK
jgi:hypothetical protein